MRTITDPVKMKAAAAYNAAADHFDDEALSLWAKYGRRTVDRIALRSDEAVLDVGCGTGASAIPAAEQVGPKGKVIAVDFAERLLDTARRKAASRNLKNVEFRLGDMEHLGCPDFRCGYLCIRDLISSGRGKADQRTMADGTPQWPIGDYHLGAASVGTRIDRLVVGSEGIAP